MPVFLCFVVHQQQATRYAAKRVGELPLRREMLISTTDLTAALPVRLKMGLVMFPGALIAAAPIIWIGLNFPGFAIIAWVVGALCAFAVLPFLMILWQVLSYRNPVLQIRQDALIFYGTIIPWTAIQGTYVGRASFVMIAAGDPDALMPQDRLWLDIPNSNSLRPPAPSRLFTYRLAKVVIHRTGGRLLLPLVTERSVDELASDIQSKIA
jgi:hypothetical protein